MKARLLDGGNVILADASSTKAIVATPAFFYAVTTQANPVKPGDKLAFTVTVTNLSNGPQNAVLSYVVPGYTDTGFQGGNPGAAENVYFSQVPIGVSRSAIVNLTVFNGGTSAPPDGTIVNLSLTDGARNATVGRSVVIQTNPLADLKLSTKEGTVIRAEHSPTPLFITM